MKRIWIFNILLCMALPLEAQEYGDNNVVEDIVSEQAQEPAADLVADQTQAQVKGSAFVDKTGFIVIDTLMPVRKSFIRRANIIFKDRDRLRAENARLRAEIADLNQDITKKNKQVKELSDYVNNQTFALNEAKKTAQQSVEEMDKMREEIELINEELVKTRKKTIGWTIGGFVVGVGIGVVIGIIASGG